MRKLLSNQQVQASYRIKRDYDAEKEDGMELKKRMCGLVKEEAGVGDIVYHDDLPVPEIADDEVLVRIRCASVCTTDTNDIMTWAAYAQKRVHPPVILGHESCGDIVAVGKAVTDRKVGDRVAIEPYITCGKCYPCTHGMPHLCNHIVVFGIGVDGAFADYAKIRAACTYPIGDDLSYEAACMLQPNGTGVHSAEVAEPEGKIVLVVGCGPLGLTAVASCKVFGAKQIIACDLFDEKLETARKMGADITINTKELDLVTEVLKYTNGDGVDVCIDYTASDFMYNKELKALRPKGRLICVALPTKPITINDFTDDLLYREIELTGISGRLIWKTWEDFETVMKSPYYKLKYVLGGRYAMSDYKSALKAMRDGKPGKMILYPNAEDLKNEENYR